MKIDDTLTSKRKELDENDPVKIYLCGPTVYDDVHIGNMRPLVLTDILVKVISINSKVKYVLNITDVDDKIINRSIEKNVNFLELSEKYTRRFLEIINLSNLSMPNHLPKVSEKINSISLYIEKAIDKKVAYKTLKGNVYFNISKYDDYGSVSKRKLDDLIDSENKNDKKNPKDFSLWKNYDENYFDSSISKGRPGWHTECSSFIDEIFQGESLDIHIGGNDLKFPHHENERAIFNSINGREISKIWMHIGQLNINGKKMSKSEGNFIYAKDFLKDYDSNLLKILFMQTQYAKPINFNDDYLNNALKTYNKIKNAFSLLGKFDFSDINYEGEFTKKGIKHLNENLNTVNYLTELFSLIKLLNKNRDNEKLLNDLYSMLSLVGIKW